MPRLFSFLGHSSTGPSLPGGGHIPAALGPPTPREPTLPTRPWARDPAQPSARSEPSSGRARRLGPLLCARNRAPARVGWFVCPGPAWQPGGRGDAHESEGKGLTRCHLFTHLFTWARAQAALPGAMPWAVPGGGTSGPSALHPLCCPERQRFWGCICCPRGLGDRKGVCWLRRPLLPHSRCARGERARPPAPLPVGETA